MCSLSYISFNGRCSFSLLSSPSLFSLFELGRHAVRTKLLVTINALAKFLGGSTNAGRDRETVKETGERRTEPEADLDIDAKRFTSMKSRRRSNRADPVVCFRLSIVTAMP